MKSSPVTESPVSKSYCLRLMQFSQKCISTTMNQTNQENLFDWKEIKKYLDRSDPDLLEAVLSKDYSSLEEFYKALHEEMTDR